MGTYGANRTTAAAAGAKSTKGCCSTHRQQSMLSLLLLLLLLRLNQLLFLSLAPLPMLRRKLLPLLCKLCHHSA